MPKVLITGFFRLPGPDRAGVQMRHVLRALAPKHNVDVLVVRHGDQAYVERQGTARILRVPISETDLRDQVEAFRRALRRQLEGADYDIVHFRDGWAGVPVLEMREALGYATVFDVARSPMAEAPILDVELAADLSRDEEACILGADSVLVPSEQARAFVTRGRPDGVHIVPLGVDVDLFDWDTPARTDAPTILYAGTIAPGRGVRVLLRAMMDVAAASPARLVIAGNVEPVFEMSLRKAISDLGLAGRVELLGAIPYEDMPALIADARLCVAPAAAEIAGRPTAIYPSKLLEYMACKRPVIAPRRGAVTLLVKNGVDGVLFTPGDPADLSRKMLKLLAKSEYRERLADAGYDLVRRHHTASATRRALRSAYAALIEQAPMPRPRFGDHPPSLTDASAISGANLIAVGDRTDEFEPSFEATGSPVDFTAVENSVESEIREHVDSGAWTVISETLPVPPGELSELPDGETATQVIENNDWIVTEQRKRRLDTWAGFGGREVNDDDGTPIDVVPAPAVSPAEENRFVAGEVEVPDAPPDIIDESAFTAVSVMLGPITDEIELPKAPDEPRTPEDEGRH